MQERRGWGALDSRDNALNAIRLGLAVAVVVSHAMIFEGVGVTELTFQMGAGAVAGFFGISGFLIAGSRDRMSFLPFIWRRVLRLMPAYWVVLVVTAGVLSPITTTLRDSEFDLASATDYVAQNFLLVQRQVRIGDTLTGGPQPYYEHVWNSALWTLPYEFGAYLVLGALFQMRPLRSVRGGVAAVVACTALYLLAGGGVMPWLDPNIGRLGAFFAAGATLYAARDRLPHDLRLAGAAAALTGYALWQGPLMLSTIGPFPIAYLLLWVGASYRGGLTERHDVSYGMYIYAFPLQQILAVTGVSARAGAVWNAALSVAVAVPLAVASWVFVERPAMRWRSLIPASPSPAPSRQRGATAVSRPDPAVSP